MIEPSPPIQNDVHVPSLDEIILVAGGLDGEERDAYLDKLTHVPSNVLQEARRLLEEADDMPDSFLDAPALGDGTASLDHDPAIEAAITASSNLSGECVGRFRLMERLGAGAMGEVYSAYDEQLDRKVAVKLVKGGVRSRADISERLLREAKTLARLSHPNVVQVYEAGTFRERVYVAMEFVRGVTLDTWRKENADKASWKDVLGLFLAAGEGLIAAHRAGLVHRDFKPANVLVGADGRVRVLDFGLARTEALADDVHLANAPQLDDAHAMLATLTQTGSILGTPAYMSPEQWQAKKVDARSDQFSFCVALYEALYGKRPFQPKTNFQLAKLTADGVYEAPPKNAQVPKRLWPILERGLAADPDKRYPDMQELLAALSWDPDKRRRTMFTAAGVVVALVASIAITAGLSARHEANPCRLAGQAVDGLWNGDVRDKITRAFQATRLPYANATWERLSSQLEPYIVALRGERVAACEATHVRHEQSDEVLNLRTICLDRRQRHLSALLDVFTQADAQIVEHAAEAAAALPRVDGCQDAEALLLGVRPPEDPDTAAKVTAIQNELARSEVLFQAVRYKEALAIAEPQWEAARKLQYRPVQADAAYAVGRILVDLVTGDEVDRAEKLLREALDLSVRSRHDVRAAETWKTLVHLSARHHSNKQFGYLWAESALSAIERAGNDSTLLVATLNETGSLYAKAGRSDDAEKMLRQALDLEQKNRVDVLFQADTWQFLANVSKDQGRFADARKAFESSIQIVRDALGEGHPRLAFVKHDYAMFLHETGEFDTARQILTESIDTWSKLYDPKHFRVGQAHIELAELERRAGRLDESAKHARTAQEIFAHALSQDDVRQARPFTVLGVTQTWRGQYAEALANYEKALAIQIRAVGEDHIVTVTNHGNIAEMLFELNRYDDVLGHVKRFEEGLDKLHKTHPLYRSFGHRLRAQWLLHEKKYDEAITLLEKARTLVLDLPGSALDRAAIEWILAQAVSKKNAPSARARELAESARAIFAANGIAGEDRIRAIDAWLGASQKTGKTHPK